MLLGMSGYTDTSSLPGMRRFPFLQNLAIYLLTPIYLLKETIEVLFFTRADVNAINNWRPLSGKKKAAHLNLNVEKITSHSKAKGCSINDVLMSLASLSLRDYYQFAKKDPDF